jgi:hypothetical protein
MCGECNWPLKLSNEDRDSFLESLKNPSEPNNKLKEGFQRYYKIQGKEFSIYQLLTVIEAAKINKVTPQAIHFAIRTKRLPAKKENNQWRIHLEDLVSYNKTKYIREKNKTKNFMVHSKPTQWTPLPHKTKAE